MRPSPSSSAISGQKPVVTKAKKSIAAFKLREGMNIGAKVTLRGERMYVFLDKLFNVVLPRIRDFRGLPPKSFDGRGNYNWACASSSSSRRSTSIRSTRRAAWTSRSSRRRRSDEEAIGVPDRDGTAASERATHNGKNEHDR